MRFILLCSVALVLAAPVAFAQMPDGGAPQAMPVVVDTVKSEVAKIWKEYSGRIRATDYVEVRPQVSGTITEIHFEDGAHVNKGDILFTIDKRPYEAALKGAQAALVSAENQMALAEKEMVRAEGLIKTNAISKRSYDERVNERNVSAAQVEAAKATLEQAQINLDYASVKAPISGYTSRAEITEGNLVDPISAPILTSIVSDAGVYADFEVDEKTYFQHLRKDNGQSADKANIEVIATSPSLADAQVSGKIHSFDNKIDPASGTIRIRAYFGNENKQLVPGMFVQVKIGTQSDEKVILLSETVIGTDQDRKFVMIAENGKAAYRPITLGSSTGGKREILSGLKDGDQVITEGLMMIRPDMPVAPMSAEEAAKQAAAAAQQAQAQEPAKE